LFSIGIGRMKQFEKERKRWYWE